MGFFGDAWAGVRAGGEAIAGGVGDVVDWVGNKTDNIGFDQSTANEFRTPAGVNQSAFAPTPEMQQAQQFAGGQAAANAAAMNDPSMTRQFDVGAQPGPYSVAGPQQVAYDAQGPVTYRADSGLAGVDARFVAQDQSRAMQFANLGNLQQMAAGQGPSVGQNAMQAGSADAAAQYLQASGNAARQMQQGQLQATGAYGDAAAQQAYATQQAGQQAAQGFQDRNQEALRSQAAMAAGARGGDAGLAMRAGMMNAATSGQRANIESGRAQMAANQQAAFNTANAQRAAMQAQSQGNLQASGMQEQAMRDASAQQRADAFRAAGLQSQEQISAIGALTGATDRMRADDLSAIGAATGAGQLGLQTDSMVNDIYGRNASGNLQAAGMNQNAGLTTEGMRLDSYNTAAGRNLQAQQGDQVTAAQMAGLYGGLGADYSGQAIGAAGNMADLRARGEQLRVEDINAAEGRAVQAGLGVGQSQVGMIGSGIGAAGALGAAIFSDRRTKEGIHEDAAPDFRGVGSYKYKYKSEFQDSSNPGGEHFGPMADELPSTVKERTRDGYEKINTGRLSLHNTSAIGDAQRRISDLEDIVSKLGGEAA